MKSHSPLLPFTRLLLFGFIGLALLGPIIALLIQLQPEQLGELLSSRPIQRSLWVTFLCTNLGAFFSCAVGVFFARGFAFRHWRGKRWQRLLFIIPYLIPNFIFAAAYVLAWNPETGLLNALLPFPGGIYGNAGMIFLFAVVHAPLCLILLEERYKRIDPCLLEAAQLSGATVWDRVLKIELPLLAPTLLSCFGLSMAMNLSAFAIPAWLGAPERKFTLTYKVYQAIQLGGTDGIPAAATIACILLVFATPALFFTSFGSRLEKRLVMLSGKSSRAAQLSQAPGLAWQCGYWALQLVTWILPLCAFILATLTPRGCLQQNGLACLQKVSLENYHYVLFELKETPLAFQSSLVWGTLSAIIMLVLSIVTLAAFADSPRLKRWIEWIFGLPVSVPGAIIALGLIVSCSGRYGINLYNSVWIVVFAYVIKHMNLAYQPVRSGFSNLSKTLAEAAQLSGARPWQIWFKIILPILRPEYLAAFFVTLIPILGELTMSVFLTSPTFRSIGTVLFDLQDYADQGAAGALSVVLIVFILILNEISYRLSRGKLGY